MTKRNPIDEILTRIQRAPEVPEHKRVLDIVKLMMRLAEFQPGMEHGPHEAAENELDILLSGYTWSTATLFQNGRVRIGFQPTWEPTPSLWERDAMLALFDADPHLIRQCEGSSGKCKGLFYATRIDNTTCSRACISARYDGDAVKYQARLETQRNNHRAEKGQQAAAALRALARGRVVGKRTRADHPEPSAIESWINRSGLGGFGGDKKTEYSVRGAVTRANVASRKARLTVVPDLKWLAARERELKPKSSDKV